MSIIQTSVMQGVLLLYLKYLQGHTEVYAKCHGTNDYLVPHVVTLLSVRILHY